jgi:hypothetical protein
MPTAIQMSATKARNSLSGSSNCPEMPSYGHQTKGNYSDGGG